MTKKSDMTPETPKDKPFDFENLNRKIKPIDVEPVGNDADNSGFHIIDEIIPDGKEQIKH